MDPNSTYKLGTYLLFKRTLHFETYLRNSDTRVKKKDGKKAALRRYIVFKYENKSYLETPMFSNHPG